MAMIARVFTKKTKYTPDDDFAFTGPPDLFTPHFDEAHISCSFSWDKSKAEQLADAWCSHADVVKVDGPAYDNPGDEFTPGMYLRHGYTLTSRGCIRKCPFCLVPKREGMLRELTIHPGPWVQDNNLLACSKQHVLDVFKMLATQKNIKLLGGLDIRLIEDWVIDEVVKIKHNLQYLYIAFDHESQRENVRSALERFTDAGLKQSQLQCFVLVGYKDDTIEEAERRCEWVITEGGFPFASYWRGPDEENFHKPKEWAELTQNYTYLPVTTSRLKRLGLKYHKKFVRGMYTNRNKED